MYNLLFENILKMEIFNIFEYTQKFFQMGTLVFTDTLVA